MATETRKLRSLEVHVWAGGNRYALLEADPEAVIRLATGQGWLEVTGPATRGFPTYVPLHKIEKIEAII